MIALLLIDDGRENYLERCRASMGRLPIEVTHKVLIEDPGHELGFAGAIQAGWNEVLKTRCTFVAHVESDFTFNMPPPWLAMVEILERDSTVQQVALLRQPWNPAEIEAGGIIQCDPGAYEERHLGLRDGSAATYTCHRKFVTTNPSVYRRELAERGWPQGPESEGKFGIHLFGERPDAVSAFWGGKDAEPAVTHIGAKRTGVGY